MKLDDKYLYDVCHDVKQGELEEANRILLELWDVVREHKGLGLAANQIGYNKRIIVINSPTLKMGMINPYILESSDNFSTAEEGCLSFPGRTRRMKRHKQVRVGWSDQLLSFRHKKLKLLDARIAQHEVDHLNGITLFPPEGENHEHQWSEKT